MTETDETEWPPHLEALVAGARRSPAVASPDASALTPGVTTSRGERLGHDAQFSGAGTVFVCSRKNRSISRLASGPRGSV